MAVYKRQSRFYYDFCIRRTRYRAAIPEARTKAQAERAETQAREEIYTGRYGGRKAPTLKAFISETFLPWARENKRSHRVDGYRCNNLIAALGNLTLDQIGPLQIEKYKRDRLGIRAARTVIHELNTLSQILGQAVDQNLITSNPCRKVRKPKPAPARQRYLTPEEESRLLAALTEPLLPGQRELRHAITIALNTGMRQGEIYSLRWHQLDFGRQVVTLRHTKTNQPRTIPLNRVLRELLTRLHADPERDEQVLTRCYHSRLWMDTCRRAGITGLTFHDLRHTAATRLAESGVDTFTISAILGQTTVQMTARYAHATSDGTRRAVEALGGYQERRTDGETKRADRKLLAL